LREVFTRQERAGLTLNKNKMHLCKKEIRFLGYRLSGEGIKVLTDRIEEILEYPPSKTVKELRRCLGMVGFYGRFVKIFSAICEPLHALKRKGKAFEWGGAQEKAFQRLKKGIDYRTGSSTPRFCKTVCVTL
jgi:hypothetical protein